MTYYDHDPARLTPGGMRISDYATSKEVGTKIRSIYTDQLLENDLGAGIRVSLKITKNWCSNFLYFLT